MLRVDDVLLHPAGALLLPAAGAVVVADLHVGYADAARARGDALPAGEPAAAALEALLDDLSGHTATASSEFRARLVIVNGDLKHARAPLLAQARAVVALDTAIRARGLDVAYVAGNHDTGLDRMLPGASVVEELEIAGWRILHGHAAARGPGPRIVGHEHPVVRLQDGLGGRVRARAFLRAGEAWVLPALSPWAAGVDVARARRFAGAALAGADPADAEAFVLAEGEVLPFGRLGDLRRAGLA